MVEWVEVKGMSVEVAVKAALEELDIEDEARAEIKVLQEPQRGFLGIGRQDAIVRVKPSPKRRRSGKGSRSSKRKKKAPSRQGPKKKNQPNKKQAAGRTSAKSKKPAGREPSKPRGKRPSGSGRKAGGDRVAEREVQTVVGDERTAQVVGEEQAAVVKDFLSGLLEEFGLEGQVDTRFDGRIVHADVMGDQTEALIGTKASVMQAVRELTKTVVQRKTARNCRLRMDIAGYGERRREALAIYAGQLAEQVLDEGGETMLEPMNAADRKVVHDAVAGVDGVRSYSEGAEPRRSVVISKG